MPITRFFLADHAVNLRDKPAVVDDRPGAPVTVWSFAELNRQANRLANLLLGLGVDPGEKVVWCGQNSLEVVRAIHALPKIGAVTVPLNYRLTADETAYVVDNSDAVAVYVDAEQAGLFARIAYAIPRVRHVIVFGGRPGPGMLSAEALLARSRDTEPEVDIPAGIPSTMLYTSGTTGRPKGALRLPSDPAHTRPLLELVGHRPDDIYLTTGPLYHSGPLGYLAINHRLGATAVLQRRFDPEDWLRLVARYRVSTTFSAPTPIRLICALPDEVKARYDVRSMRRMIANAAPWSMALKEAYMRRLRRGLPLGGLWLHRAGRGHRARPAGPPAEAGLLRPRGARRGDPALRRGGRRGDRARRTRRGIRPQREHLRRLPQGGGQDRRDPPRRLRHRRRHRLPRRGRASTTSATASAT